MTSTDKAFFDQNGYTIVRGLFGPDEVAVLRAHFMTLRETGTYPGDSAGIDRGSDDPLKRYPRMIHMHRWDKISLAWLLDRRLTDIVTTLLETPPLAVQTMLYFKPAGARGQALHQDQHYLRARPGTCMAAWMALDACDEANGCMQVIPASHQWPVLCAEKADTSASFTDVTVPARADRPLYRRPGAAGHGLRSSGFATGRHAAFYRGQPRRRPVRRVGGAGRKRAEDRNDRASRPARPGARMTGHRIPAARLDAQTPGG